MKFDMKAIADSAFSMMHRTGFEMKKHSPEIFIVVGIVGVVTSTVLACKATMKVSDVAKESKKEIDDIKDDTTKTEKEISRELTVAYVKTGVRFAKLYAPSVAIGVLSLTAIVASNQILHKRNLALAAAYTALDKGYTEYRSRVADRFGEEAEREIRYNIHKEKVEETVTDENGKTKKVKKEIEVVDDLTSPYSVYFDNQSSYFEDNPQYNQMFLKARESYANQILSSRGHLFLNEVYDMLGLDRTVEGQTIGWVYDKNNPKRHNCVDFGIFNLHAKVNRDFANGFTPIVLLDFNVDGNIMNEFVNKQ